MKLNLHQKQLLHELANEQLKRPNTEEILGEFLKKNLIEIVNKIESGPTNFIKNELIAIDFLKKELLMAEAQYPYDDDSLFWLHLTEPQKKQYMQKDCLLDILNNYSKRYPSNITSSRYRNVYSLIEKMKKSQKILLSINPDPYKIGFVYDNSSLFRFDLKHPLRLYSNEVSFEQYTKHSNNEFTGVYTKREALRILQKTDSESYINNSFQFVMEILQWEN